MPGWGHVLLAVGMCVAACGGEVDTAPPSRAPGAPSSTPLAQPSAATTTTQPAAPTSAPGTSASHVELKLPLPSAMGADLQALGIEPAELPPIEKLDPKALRGVMKLFARSLGARCSDCHLEGDFAAPTRRKKIAARMWNDFAAKLSTASGSPLFCDSCHQGRILQLDRSDKQTLAKWMATAFVDGLRRSDGKPQACETCHVNKDMHFLASWGR